MIKELNNHKSFYIMKLVKTELSIIASDKKIPAAHQLTDLRH